MSGVPQLLGDTFPIQGRLSPEPGQWLVIFKKGGGRQLIKAGQRRWDFGLGQFQAASYAKLRTSTVTVDIRFSHVPLGDSLFLPSAAITLGFRIDPESDQVGLLALLESEGAAFTTAIESRLTDSLERHVRTMLEGADPLKIYSAGFAEFVFPGGTVRLDEKFIHVTMARVIDVTWPEGVLAQIANMDSKVAEVALTEIEVRAAQRRREAELIEVDHEGQLAMARAHVDAEIALKRVVAERADEFERAALAGRIQFAQVEAAQKLSRELNIPLMSIPGPWTAMQDRNAELLGKALENHTLSRRPEILQALVALTSGQSVGNVILERQAEQVLDSVDPDRVRNETITNQLDVGQSADILDKASFQLDAGLNGIWESLDTGVGLKGASYGLSGTEASIILVADRDIPVPDGLRTRIIEVMNLDEFSKVRFDLVTGSTVRIVLRQLITRFAKLPPGIDFDLYLRQRADGRGEIVVELRGDRDECERIIARVNNPHEPWLLAAENSFARGRLRFDRR
ncbi:hypothetical protein CH292_10620 [Rhodococcus sp. 14-2470-1a]|nr:hypothetical protein CH292_10620 [Rhodococcus sp. 14-2470-1a]